MIPVIGIPYINRPDLLLRTLGSIDVEVGDLVLIDNSKNADIANLEGPSRCRVIAAHHNLGVSASWNLIIKSTPKAAWWLLANSDVKFMPGELAALVEAMNGFDGLCLMGSMASFAVTPGAIERAGWFDENFIPAYAEDNDFLYRCELTGVEVKNIGSQYEHEGSAAIRSDPALWNNNNRTYPMNVDYYRRKWGGGIGTEETFGSPFNLNGDPREWHLDIRRLADMTWE